MDHLWAPWRAQYIQQSPNASSTEAPEAHAGCFFCRGLSQTDHRENLLVWRGPHSVVFLNRYPYNNGHLLVAPTVHLGRLSDLEGEDLLEPLKTVRWCVNVLDTLLNPQGYNIGLNMGKSAGAGVPGHLHWHIVPRWDGDTNFMPVLSETKVIVESLFAFYDRLAPRFSSTT